jgi:hypothetical protein
MVSDWNCLKYFCVFFYCNNQVLRDFLITLYNAHKMHTSIPPAVFEPPAPASERPQNNALECAGHWNKQCLGLLFYKCVEYCHTPVLFVYLMHPAALIKLWRFVTTCLLLAHNRLVYSRPVTTSLGSFWALKKHLIKSSNFCIKHCHSENNRARFVTNVSWFPCKVPVILVGF